MFDYSVKITPADTMSQRLEIYIENKLIYEGEFQHYVAAAYFAECFLNDKYQEYKDQEYKDKKRGTQNV
jgi:hypothetical protein